MVARDLVHVHAQIASDAMIAFKKQIILSVGTHFLGWQETDIDSFMLRHNIILADDDQQRHCEQLWIDGVCYGQFWWEVDGIAFTAKWIPAE